MKKSLKPENWGNSPVLLSAKVAETDNTTNVNRARIEAKIAELKAAFNNKK